MFKKFLGVFIDLFCDELYFMKKYFLIYICIVFMMAIHVCMPDTLTAAVFGNSIGSEELLHYILSGDVGLFALNIWLFYWICLILFKLFIGAFYPNDKALKSKVPYSWSELFCVGICTVGCVNLSDFYMKAGVESIVIFGVLKAVLHIVFRLCVRILKLDSTYFGYHSNDGKDITTVSEDTYQLLCTQYRVLYEQSEELDSNDNEYALCHAQLRAVRAVLTTLGFKEDDFERIESEQGASRN